MNPRDILRWHLGFCLANQTADLAVDFTFIEIENVLLITGAIPSITLAGVDGEGERQEQNWTFQNVAGACYAFDLLRTILPDAIFNQAPLNAFTATNRLANNHAGAMARCLPAIGFSPNPGNGVVFVSVGVLTNQPFGDEAMYYLFSDTDLRGSVDCLRGMQLLVAEENGEAVGGFPAFRLQVTLRIDPRR